MDITNMMVDNKCSYFLILTIIVTDVKSSIRSGWVKNILCSCFSLLAYRYFLVVGVSHFITNLVFITNRVL